MSNVIFLKVATQYDLVFFGGWLILLPANLYCGTFTFCTTFTCNTLGFWWSIKIFVSALFCPLWAHVGCMTCAYLDLVCVAFERMNAKLLDQPSSNFYYDMMDNIQGKMIHWLYIKKPNVALMLLCSQVMFRWDFLTLWFISSKVTFYADA